MWGDTFVMMPFWLEIRALTQQLTATQVVPANAVASDATLTLGTIVAGELSLRPSALHAALGRRHRQSGAASVLDCALLVAMLVLAAGLLVLVLVCAASFRSGRLVASRPYVPSCAVNDKEGERRAVRLCVLRLVGRLLKGAQTLGKL